MKTRILLLVAALVAAFCFTGCATKTSNDTPLLQSALDATLPPAFTGYAKVSHSNQYFDIAIEADALERTDKGWKWSWLSYTRKSHFPFWSSTGEVTLGRRPQ